MFICIGSQGITNAITTLISFIISMVVWSWVVCDILCWAHCPLMLKRAVQYSHKLCRQQATKTTSVANLESDAALNQNPEMVFQPTEGLFNYTPSPVELVVE